MSLTFPITLTLNSFMVRIQFRPCVGLENEQNATLVLERNEIIWLMMRIVVIIFTYQT